jgi:hypothetical protein
MHVAAMMLDRHIAPAICPRCGGPMKLVRSVPRLGGLPELRAFSCSACGEVETQEVDGRASPR